MTKTYLYIFVMSALNFAYSGAEMNRPCVADENINSCVGYILAMGSNCNDNSLAVIKDALPQKLTIKVPLLKITVDETFINVKDLTMGNVEDFYYDAQSKQAVLTIKFKQVTISGNLKLSWMKTPHKPLVFYSNNSIQYNDLTVITTMIKNPKLVLSSSTTTAVLKGKQVTVFEHGIINTGNEPVSEDLKALRNLIAQNSNVAENAALKERAELFSKAYINTQICNFPSK